MKEERSAILFDSRMRAPRRIWVDWGLGGSETYYPGSPMVLQLLGKFAGHWALAAVVRSWVWSLLSLEAVMAAWKVPST